MPHLNAVNKIVKFPSFFTLWQWLKSIWIIINDREVQALHVKRNGACWSKRVHHLQFFIIVVTKVRVSQLRARKRYSLNNIILTLRISEWFANACSHGDVESGNNAATATTSGMYLRPLSHTESIERIYPVISSILHNTFPYPAASSLRFPWHGGGLDSQARRISAVVSPLMSAIGSIFDARNTRFRGKGASDVVPLPSPVAAFRPCEMPAGEL